MSQRILATLILGLSVLLNAACLDRDPAFRAPVYVALGASDAVGVGARDPETEGWVPRLHASMPPGTRLVNLGVSGSQLSEALDQQLPVALAAEPDIVTVWLAVNDLKNGVPLESYERDLDRLLRELAATDATVLVGNVPDLASLPVSDEQLRTYGAPGRTALRAEINVWNAAIARAAERHGAIVVNIHAEWRELQEHPEYISADGFHPSTEGYARMAELWQTALTSASGP